MTCARAGVASSTPAPPHAAEQPAEQTAVGAPKGAARQGVRSALRPDPHPASGARQSSRGPVAWLHIVAPRYQGAVSTATSTCACGWHRQAAGVRQVLALVADHTDHRTTCPLRHRAETRNAA